MPWISLSDIMKLNSSSYPTNMDYKKLDALFHPKSIAVIGASDNIFGSFMMKILLDYEFRGKIYPVNRRGGEVMGIKAYPSVIDIPDSVDYAFLQVPAQASIQVIKDCAAKGIKLATLFTAGFGESEIKGGSELEQELLSTARQCGVRLLGPNCMGVYCPSAYLPFALGFPKETGAVGALCQSGGNSIQLVRAASQRGIRFSKVISFGNATDLNEADLLEYFTQDTETKIIIAYIEGVKEGKRFFQALKVAAQNKPVIVLKGGQSEAGAATTLSHTGSLSGSTRVWDSLLKQAGIIQAYDIDECVDIALALLFMNPPVSKRAAVIGFGGGAIVQAADDCYRAGLLLPPLPQEIREELKQFVPIAGNIFRNPMDFGGIHFIPSEMSRAVKIIGGWTGTDSLILCMGIEIAPISLISFDLVAPLAEALINAARELGKPTVLAAYASYSTPACQEVLKVREICAEAGFPFYHSIPQAANAISKLIRYHQAH